MDFRTGTYFNKNIEDFGGGGERENREEEDELEISYNKAFYS